MVKGAHKERRILLENNPHLTNWVPIAVPIDKWISWPPPFGHPLFAIAPLILPAVFKFYDSMSGFSCPPSHIMGKQRAERKFPQLKHEDAKYYSVFYEGQHDDSRTNTYIALTAAEEGSSVANYVEMIDVIKNNEGKAIGVRARDNLSGKEFEIHAKVGCSISHISLKLISQTHFKCISLIYIKAIIFAGGPFTDKLRQIEDPSCKPAVAAAAGTHIVLPDYYCAKGIGMLDINTSDGRFLFFLPWQGKTLVGTTDRKGPVNSFHGPPEEEIQWILNEAKKYLVSDTLKVRRSDVLSAWQGFRPLASDPHAPPGAPVSRDHVISYNEKTGVTFITGGKWTTYREMAEDVINKVIKTHGLESKAGQCHTEKISLRGGKGYHRNVPIQIVQEFGISPQSAEHLSRSYGIYAFDVCQNASQKSKSSRVKCGNLLIEGYPYLEYEVEYACKYEMACTVVDYLTLRTRLAYLDSEAALLAAPKVADLMAQALGWSEKEKKQQLETALNICRTFGGPVPSKMVDDAIDESEQSDKYRFTAEKLGKGAENSGAAFG